MIEGALSNCYCVVPNKLSYVELFPPECRYNTEKQLAKLLRRLVKSGKHRIKEQTTKLALEDKLLPIVSHESVTKNIIHHL